MNLDEVLKESISVLYPRTVSYQVNLKRFFYMNFYLFIFLFMKKKIYKEENFKALGIFLSPGF